MRRIHWLTDFVDDVRYAIRSLRRTPGLAVFVVLTLALGIGMISATFSMVDAVIFRPYPVPHPSGVVTLVSTTHDSQRRQFLLSRIPGHPRQDQELRRRDRQRRYGSRRLQRRTRSYAADQGRNAGFR